MAGRSVTGMSHIRYSIMDRTKDSRFDVSRAIDSRHDCFKECPTLDAARQWVSDHVVWDAAHGHTSSVQEFVRHGAA